MSSTGVCRYKEGFKASDYAPIHGMVIREFYNEEVLLQLIVYSPQRVRENNMFAWAIYRFNKENDTVGFVRLDKVQFDESVALKNQCLPDLDTLGTEFYKKLTDGSLYDRS